MTNAYINENIRVSRRSFKDNPVQSFVFRWQLKTKVSKDAASIPAKLNVSWQTWRTGLTGNGSYHVRDYVLPAGTDCYLIGFSSDGAAYIKVSSASLKVSKDKISVDWTGIHEDVRQAYEQAGSDWAGESFVCSIDKYNDPTREEYSNRNITF